MALKQVGTMALRGPDGKFLPSVPLYADIPDKDIQPSGLTMCEEKNCDEILDMLADKFKQYIDGCKKAGIPLEVEI